MVNNSSYPPIWGKVNLVKISAAPIPAKLAVATIDKSIPPVNIASITAIASKPNSGIWLNID